MRASLRLAVHALRVQHRSSRFASTLHVGQPRAAELTCQLPSPGRVDHGLRTDVCEALLGRWPVDDPAPWIWVARAGQADPTPHDLAWLRAASRAADTAGRELAGLIVLTKGGWTAPFVPDQERWLRLRIR